MEAFLNFLWVLIAAVALGIWRTRWQHERRESQREPLREWTAIGCALVLLFFAVSLTDDLHSEAILSDGFASTRSHPAWCSHAAENGNNVHAEAPAVLASRIVTPKLRKSEPAVIFPAGIPPASSTEAIPARSPPVSFL